MSFDGQNNSGYRRKTAYARKKIIYGGIVFKMYARRIEIRQITRVIFLGTGDL